MAAIRDLLESSLKTYLSAQALGASVYAGFEGSPGDKLLPCVIARAVSSQMVDWPSGNIEVECSVEVKATATDTGFNTLCNAVRNSLCLDDLHDQLTGGDLKVFGVVGFVRIEWDIEEDVKVERYVFTLYCCESSLTGG